MEKKPLTARTIETAIRSVERGEKPSIILRDGRVPGLALLLGKRTARWTYEYKAPLAGGGWSAGRRMPLGDLDEIDIDTAREKAIDAKREIARGIDPVAAKRAKRQANIEAAASRTVGDAVARYIEQRSPDWAATTRKHFGTDLTFIRDVLGADTPLGLVDRETLVGMIADFLEAQREAGATGVRRAHRIAALTSSLWRQASAGTRINPGWNWPGIDQTVAASLPVPGRSRLTSRSRVLDPTEIASAWKVLRDGVPGVSAGRGPRLVLQLSLTTGLRLGALSLCRVEDLHLDPPRVVGALDTGPWIRIPAENGRKFDAKSRREGSDLHLPLSSLATRLFREAISLHRAASPYVFPGRRGRPLSPSTASKAWTDLVAAGALPLGTVAHDLRRSMRTHLAETDHPGGFEQEELLVGHKIGGAVARVYDRSRKLAKLRPVAEAWGRRLEQVVAGQPAELVALSPAPVPA